MTTEEIVFAAVSEVKIKEEFEFDEPNLIISPWNDSGRNDCHEEEEPVKKCGEVMLTLGGKLTFICASCNYQFLDLQIFGDHFRDSLCGFKVYDDLESSSDSDETFDSQKVHFPSHIEALKQHHDENLQKNLVSIIDHAENDTIRAEAEPLIKQTGSKDPVQREFFEYKENCLNVKITGIEEKHEAEDHSNTLNLQDNRDDEESQAAQEIRASRPVCCVCCRIYLNEKNFRVHLRRQHDGFVSIADIKNVSVAKLEEKLARRRPEIVCRYCDKHFTKLAEFKTHLHTHSGPTSFTCKYCPKTFVSKYCRQIHMNTHQDIRPYKCSHCSQSFSNPTNLKSHERIHLKILKFVCKYCGKGFVKGTDRRIHERIHTKELPYQCEECGLRFISQIKLTHHIRRHRNIKDFKCSQCDKAFYSQYLLRDHMRIHNKERPFGCPTCGKTFSRRKTLGQHMYIHAAVKRFVCKTCGKAFAQAPGLRSHVKTHGELVR